MHTYIIAEIGQNHNGDMDIARQLIDAAAAPIEDRYFERELPRVDAVKFTKRDLAEELSAEAAAKPYVNANSFGPTYLEHRQALELSYEQHAELERYAHSKGLDFIETLCSPATLKLLDMAKIDAIKIASRDVTNIPLIEALGKLSHHIIVSTGICSMDELRQSLDILSSTPKKISVLHCLSEYPSRYENINLRSIHYLQKEFPRLEIGFSDHSIGIAMPIVAVGMGATVIEKHFTLDRAMKGTDHAGSLAPDGLYRMTRDIRNTEMAMGEEKKDVHPAAQSAKVKLERSLAARDTIKAGDILTEENLVMLSPGDGLKWEDRKKIVGKRALRDIEASNLLKLEDFDVA